MNTSKRAELAASIHHIETFSKSGIPIYNSEDPHTAGKKIGRRRTQAIIKRYAFHTDSIKQDSSVDINGSTVNIGLGILSIF